MPLQRSVCFVDAVLFGLTAAFVFGFRFGFALLGSINPREPLLADRLASTPDSTSSNLRLALRSPVSIMSAMRCR